MIPPKIAIAMVAIILFVATALNLMFWLISVAVPLIVATAACGGTIMLGMKFLFDFVDWWNERTKISQNTLKS